MKFALGISALLIGGVIILWLLGYFVNELFKLPKNIRRGLHDAFTKDIFEKVKVRDLVIWFTGLTALTILSEITGWPN